ncbi:PAS domain-containing protein [bacterium]|nr:PAS domain-containing protein [bacterium]
MEESNLNEDRIYDPKTDLEALSSSRFLEQLLSHLQGGVFTVNKEKKITFFSKAATWMTGYCVGEVRGKNCEEVLKCGLCDKACPFDNIIKKGISTYRNEVTIYDKDDKPLIVNVTAFPLKSRDNEIIGMCEIVRDVSEITTLRNQVMQSDRFAMLGQVAASVAHEINNPLNGLLTYIKLIRKKMLSDSGLGEKYEKYLSIMERETVNMGRIVRNLLNFSRRSEPEFMPLQLNEILEQSLLLIVDPIKTNNIEVIQKVSDVLPEIRGDFGQLQQVFMNIILNSVQAMPKGGKLIIETIPEGSSGRECFVRVNITDTGIGIPEENLPKIFDPLFTTKAGKEGMGLGFGLSIVERIIKAHHAHISVRSVVGEGTTFSIRFTTK